MMLSPTSRKVSQTCRADFSKDAILQVPIEQLITKLTKEEGGGM